MLVLRHNNRKYNFRTLNSSFFCILFLFLYLCRDCGKQVYLGMGFMFLSIWMLFRKKLFLRYLGLEILLWETLMKFMFDFTQVDSILLTQLQGISLKNLVDLM